jgi:hypothetical protein
LSTIYSKVAAAGVGKGCFSAKRRKKDICDMTHQPLTMSTSETTATEKHVAELCAHVTNAIKSEVTIHTAAY